jgi:O-antigen/teichoic acid export membrane protein
MSNGENSILQGCRRLKSLAMRNMAGSVCGLVIGVPLYYWKGVDGIVPAFIISAIVLYAFSLWGTRQIKFVNIRQTWKESAGICRSLIVIGIMITFGTCLGDAARYGILGFIRMYGSINDVGLYNAANSITNQYCSLIFTAMATDYYPRLCSIINSKDETQRLINQQSELLVFILAPVVCAVILVAPIIIRVLLTAEFMSIVTIVRFFAFGLLFKAICFPFGYMILAKGDKKLYLATDCIWTNIKTPAIFISMYYFFSLPGLGYATVLNSAIDVCVSLTIMKWRYGISYGVKFFRMIALIVICLSGCFASSFIDNVYVSYGLMAVFTIAVSVVSYKELDKRIKIKELLKSKLKR